MSATLSSDASNLQGASAEGKATQIESMAALMWGVILAFIFSWPVAICGFLICPFIVISSAVSAKLDKQTVFNAGEENQDGKEQNAAELLVGDTIQNYKTVQSFGNDQVIIEEYQEIILQQMQGEIIGGRIFGFSWGLSQAIQNMSFGVLYYCTARLQAAWPDYEYLNGEDMYIAMFSLLFGAFTAGQASQFGPDMIKAKASAVKIFKIVMQPSLIDVQDENQENKVTLSEGELRGEIEFRNVWFRYPTRLD